MRDRTRSYRLTVWGTVDVSFHAMHNLGVMKKLHLQMFMLKESLPNSVFFLSLGHMCFV